MEIFNSNILFVRYRNRGTNMNKLEQSTCKRCGRKLRNPEAIQIGMGITCWRKYQREDNHKKLWRTNTNDESKKSNS